MACVAVTFSIVKNVYLNHMGSFDFNWKNGVSTRNVDSFYTMEATAAMHRRTKLMCDAFYLFFAVVLIRRKSTQVRFQVLRQFHVHGR